MSRKEYLISTNKAIVKIRKMIEENNDTILTSSELIGRLRSVENKRTAFEEEILSNAKTKR